MKNLYQKPFPNPKLEGGLLALDDDDDDDDHPGYPIPPIPSHPGKKHGVRPKILT